MARSISGRANGVYVKRPSISSHKPLKPIEVIRQYFPETWLWNNMTLGANGKVELKTTVPDTITSWFASAFALNANTGLGITDNKAKFTVFRPFFVSINMPYSIIRNEEFALQVTVFNYMDHDITDALVTLSTPEGGIKIRKDGHYAKEDPLYDPPYAISNLHIPKGGGKTVSFWIVAQKLGRLPLKITAQSSMAADGVQRKLLVEPEGSPIENNQASFVRLNKQGTKNMNVEIPSPTATDGYVAGSKRIEVSVVGDIMGSTIEGLDKLLKMPYGCGEQNMLNFVPNIVVSRYLEVIGQLTAKIQTKANKFMGAGYQRELRYKRDDSSFSAFGQSDHSGSMWLTAFVAKSFHQAQQVKFLDFTIDPDVISNATRWIVSKKKRDGSYPEPGRVIHKRMQGGSAKGLALTAYVLSTLLEVGDQSSADTTRYLEAQWSSVTDAYTLAIVAYALTLANSSQSQNILDRLNRETKTSTDGGMKYLESAKEPEVEVKRIRYWQPDTTKASDIEMNSYLLLTYTAKRNLAEGQKIAQWLTSKQNKAGGFKSTQDTMMGLMALAKFAEAARAGTQNIQVSLEGQGTTYEHQFQTITQSNAIMFQSTTIPGDKVESLRSLNIQTSGTGTAIVQVTTYYNLDKDEGKPSIELVVTTLQNNVHQMTVSACTKWKKAEGSGMSVIQFGKLSGYSADIEKIQKDKRFKLVEVMDKTVDVYVDELTLTDLCVDMPLTRDRPVAHVQMAPVVAYSYYDPSQKAMKFYGPKTDVDVCSMAGSSLGGCTDPVQPVVDPVGPTKPIAATTTTLKASAIVVGILTLVGFYLNI